MSSYIQSTHATGGSQHGQTLVLNGAGAGHALLVFTFSSNNGDVVTGVTDNFSASSPADTYVQVGTTCHDPDCYVRAYLALNVHGGDTTISVAASNAYIDAIAMEYPAVSADKTAESTYGYAWVGGSPSVFTVGPTGTTVQDNEVLVAAFHHEKVLAHVSAGTGYTQRESFTNSDIAVSFFAEDRDVAATGAYSATLNDSDWVNDWYVSGVLVTLELASATHSISGALGAGGAGANVSYTGTASGSVTADGSGNYTITGLANGDYVVTPVKAGYFVIPPNPTVTSDLYGAAGFYGSGLVGIVVNGADVTGVNFTLDATALGNKNFQDSAASSVSSQTSVNWQSYFGNIISVHTDAAIKGLTVSVADLLDNLYADDGNGWWHCVSIGGGSNGLAANNAVTVTYSGSSSYLTLSTTETSWNPAGILGVTTYGKTVGSSTSVSQNIDVLTKNSIVFAAVSGSAGNNTPTAIGVTKILGDGIATDIGDLLTFGSELSNYTVGFSGLDSGTLVLDIQVLGWYNNFVRGNCGVGGATVSYSGPASGSVTADVSGNYAIPLLASGTGTYTITPSGSGLSFSPTNNTVNVTDLGVDATGPTFTASLSSPMSGVTVYYTATDTTITATWTTTALCDSKAFAGAKAAVDNALPSAETSHSAIITGLDPSTMYACYAQSLGSDSATTNVTTSPAQPRFQISGALFGSLTAAAQTFDTLFNFKSDDGKHYATGDDIIAGSGFSSSSLSCVTIDNPTTMALTQVNALSGYGTASATNGQDAIAGAANTASQKKWGCGFVSLAGNLFGFPVRQCQPGGQTGGFTAGVYYEYRQTVVRSLDKGVTWENYLYPSIVSTSGLETIPVTSYCTDQALIKFCGVVRYAPDDGTLGYTTSGNGIDGGNGFIYLVVSTSDYSAIGLARIARRSLCNFTSPIFQYWIGSTSPTPTDFVNDSNWGSSSSSMTNIFTDPNSVPIAQWAHITFFPRLNSYLLCTSDWNSGTSTRIVLASASTPAGPWTVFYNQNDGATWDESPCPLHGDVAANAAAQNLSIRTTFCTFPKLTYNPGIRTLTYTTSAYPISGNCGIGGATVSYSGTASGSVTADALGYYAISDLANGSYTVTPTKPGYTFSPPNSPQTVSDADIPGIDFTASPSSGHSISGNAGIGNATVSYTGTASGSMVADGSGNYTIPSLADGTYTVTPTKSGYTFSPTDSGPEVVSGADIPGIDFTAIPVPPTPGKSINVPTFWMS